MPDSEDALFNAVYGGIKRGIEVALEHETYGAALVLIYSGLDAMANLGRPNGQAEVTAENFITWCDRYLNIPSDIAVSGEEWYSARCAVLHTYGSESRMTRSGSARQLGHMVGGYPPIRYDASVSDELVMIEIGALAEAFFTGIDDFLVALHVDGLPHDVIEARAQKLLSVFPYGQV